MEAGDGANEGSYSRVREQDYRSSSIAAVRYTTAMERIEFEITGSAEQLQTFCDRLQAELHPDERVHADLPAGDSTATVPAYIEVPVVAHEAKEGELPRMLHRIQLAVMQVDPSSEVLDWRHGAQMRLIAN